MARPGFGAGFPSTMTTPGRTIASATAARTANVGVAGVPIETPFVVAATLLAPREPVNRGIPSELSVVATKGKSCLHSSGLNVRTG
jgi:hypothetical protein